MKHAVAVSPGKVTITLAAREEHGRLVVTVGDDAPSPRGDGATRPGHGIGLANVRDRLVARFGDQAAMASGRTVDGYVTHLRMPLIRREGNG